MKGGTALLLILVVIAAIILFPGWIFMLLVGTLFHAGFGVPLLSFGASIAPGFLIAVLTGGIGAAGSASR